jgi:hypothetical protein
MSPSDLAREARTILDQQAPQQAIDLLSEIVGTANPSIQPSLEIGLIAKLFELAVAEPRLLADSTAEGSVNIQPFWIVTALLQLADEHPGAANWEEILRQVPNFWMYLGLIAAESDEADALA